MLALLGGPPVRTEPWPSWPVFDETDVEAVADVVRAGEWGREGAHHLVAFEQAFAAAQGAKYCLVVSSGTSALEVALQALRLPRGGEVILSPVTFIASANAILNTGLVPVFVDVDPGTYNIDPSRIEPAITDRTVAIMAIHLGGFPSDMQPIMDIASAHGLRVIEDAAQGHGGTWRDRGLGTIGDVGCFSFQGSKNLNAGEGGAVMTNDADIYTHAIEQHDHYAGMRAKREGQRGDPSLRTTSAGWSYPTASGNRRMSPFQAALLQVQLGRLDEQTERRAENAAHLTGLLEDVEGISVRRYDEFATRPAYYMYFFEYDPAGFHGLSRERLIEALQAEGVPVGIGSGAPVYRSKIFENVDGALARVWPRNDSTPDIDYRQVSCREAERLCTRALLSISQFLLLDTKTGMEQIAEAFEKVRAHVADLA